MMQSWTRAFFVSAAAIQAGSAAPKLHEAIGIQLGDKNEQYEK